MPRNMELKAHLPDPAAAALAAADLATDGPVQLVQCDTYFVCNRGRLKLRQHAGGVAQLIWYHREDTTKAKRSDYQIVEVQDPESLRTTLAAALGIDTIVKKRRQLWWVNNVRMHLDHVEGLGHFLELEAVLDENHDDPGEAMLVVEELARQLGIRPADRIAGSYREMM